MKAAQHRLVLRLKESDRLVDGPAAPGMAGKRLYISSFLERRNVESGDDDDKNNCADNDGIAEAIKVV